MRCEQHGETADAATLREQFRHVHWIGGGSGAGKSIIARRLAVRRGLCMYATDEVMSDHDGPRHAARRPVAQRVRGY
jgi:adenylylsulfate kinase-like enzyme